MTDSLLSAEQIEAMLKDATPGRRVQFHPSYCSEAKDTPFSDWDTSHDLSVICVDGTRQRLATYKHARDAALSQAAPDLARTALAALARAEAAEAELSAGSFYKEADIDALMNRAEAAEAEVARLTGALQEAADSLDWADHHLEKAGVVSVSVRSAATVFRATLKGASHEN